MDLTDFRKDYTQGVLTRKQLNSDPFKQFEQWLQKAITTKDNIIEPYVMTLATGNKQGKVFARQVILRNFTENGFVFYTNYQSLKAKQINDNSSVALCFYWYWLERQVRIEGKAIKTSREVSETYFKSRPYESQISAWVSQQSTVVNSREELEAEFENLKQKYPQGQVPLPDNWGGYCIKPENFEFWQGRPGRLHDRFFYENKNGMWYIVRLAP